MDEFVEDFIFANSFFSVQNYVNGASNAISRNWKGAHMRLHLRREFILAHDTKTMMNFRSVH
jgi:hypothetical protein